MNIENAPNASKNRAKNQKLVISLWRSAPIWRGGGVAQLELIFT
jgi:hypothetical protein